MEDSPWGISRNFAVENSLVAAFADKAVAARYDMQIQTPASLMIEALEPISDSGDVIIIQSDGTVIIIKSDGTKIIIKS